MEWSTYLIGLLIGLWTGLCLFYRKIFSYWKDRGIKYLEPKIPLGNLPFQRRGQFKELFQQFYDLRHGAGPFVGGFFSIQPIIVATDLDFVKDVLIKDFNSFHGRGIYTNERDDPLSAHLFSLDGPKWKSLRTKLSPTFTSGKMKFMFPTIVKVAERFHQTLDEVLEKENVLDVKDILARFTTDVIGTCAFGIDCNSLKGPDTEFRKYGRLVFEDPNTGIFRRVVMLFPKLGRRLRVMMTRKDVSDFFMGIVRETIDYRERENIKRNDFMDMLIHLKNNETMDVDNNVKLEKLTFEQVAAQAFVFFIAGFETSSTMMMFSLYEMCLNPEIQEKAREEINAVLAKYNGELTYEAVKDMVYLDRIINETLRKYPPLVALRRTAQGDYQVPNTETVIRDGTPVLIPVYSIHHDPEHFPEPEKFDPNRFHPEQMQSRHSQAFLGFGDGPRNCIGTRFGQMQSRVGLIMLLKHYTFLVDEKTPIPIVFSSNNPVLSPKDLMYLKIEKI